MQSFTELSLSPAIAQAIKDMGYETPSPIQAQTLPILLGEPTDFLGLAATGTGKTAAFAIPMLERLDPALRSIQCLILCPTRELALQVGGQVDLLGKHMGVKSVAVYGGSPYGEQIRGFRSGAQVVVGTPGRVVDHIDKGTLRLDDLKVIILDEADEMISMGFKEDMEKILAAMPREASNTWLFSATMSKEVSRVADTYLRNPQKVQVNRKEMLPTTVEQFYYPTQEGNKPEILVKLIEAAEDFYGLIFCQTKALVVDLTQYLSEKGFKVDSLHGDKDQNARERTMLAFRNRKVNILVCTDVASRGLDVKDITHVINYSLPRELDNYVHRIGRTARSGKTGIAMNLVTPSHRRLIFQIESLTKTRMVEGVIPSRREIGAKKLAKHLPRFLEQAFHARAIEVMNDEWKAALAGMSAEEVAGRFMTMMMPDVFNDRERRADAVTDAAPVNVPTDAAGRYQARERERGASRGGFERSERPARRERPTYQDHYARNDRPSRPSRGPGAGAGEDERPAFRAAAAPAERAERTERAPERVKERAEQATPERVKERAPERAPRKFVKGEDRGERATRSTPFGAAKTRRPKAFAGARPSDAAGGSFPPRKKSASKHAHS